MKPKSKSKTFPKGTDFQEIGDWLEDLFIHATEQVTKNKVLITVTKYDTDKEEDKG